MTREEAIKLINDRMCWGRGIWSEHHMPEIDEYWQAGVMAIEALETQGYAAERYVDLCGYFDGCSDKGAGILHDRNEFKKWLERMKWHVLECDKLARQLEALKAQIDKDINVPCKDTISRQAAIELIDAVFPVDPMKSEYAQGIACGAALAKTYIEQLPSAQPEPNYDEWCTDCKEYDKERHCCPRWNRVIRETLKDAPPEIIRCKDCLVHGICRFEQGLGLDGYCSQAERRTDE